MNRNDVKSEQMLVAIDENGGSASTTEIREMTGLGNDAVNYRHRKLENEGYIDVDPLDVERGALKAEVAHLTEQGRTYIDEMEAGADFEVDVPDVDPEEF